MNLRRLRSLLWTFAAVMAGMAILSILWATTSSVDIGGQALRHGAGSTDPQKNAPVVPGVTAKDFTQVAQLDLRRSLHDAPPAPQVRQVAAKAAPPLVIRLAGTIVEPGHCRAMIQLADGSLQLKGIGEVVGQARITDIQEGRVTVEYFGTSVELTVHKDTGS